MPKKFMVFDHDFTVISNSTEKSKIVITILNFPACIPVLQTEYSF